MIPASGILAEDLERHPGRPLAGLARTAGDRRRLERGGATAGPGRAIGRSLRVPA